jgi:hypothetical protein
MVQCSAFLPRGSPCKRRSTFTYFNDQIGLCSQHFRKIVNEDNEFFLVHGTHSIEKIIESGGVLPLSVIKNENVSMISGEGPYEELDDENKKFYDNSIFTSVIFPFCPKDKCTKQMIFFPPDAEYGDICTYSDLTQYFIVFPASVLLKHKDIHFTLGWNMGLYDNERSISYDHRMTVEQNLNLFRHLNFSLAKYKDRETLENFPIFCNGTTFNELIINTSNDSNKILSLDDSIFIYKRQYYANEDDLDLTIKYPEYNWVFQNPFYDTNLSDVYD